MLVTKLLNGTPVISHEVVITNQNNLYLAVVLWLFTLVTLANTAAIPLSKAPDEYVHFLYGQFIVQNGSLPTNSVERQQAGYKSDQPPLYHSLLALSMAWVDTKPPPKLKMTWDHPRRILVDLMLPRAMIVRTEDETWPYQGEILAWMAGRWLSVCLGVITLILVYLITLEIFPRQHFFATCAAAIIAFTPHFNFISAVLSDENLLAVITSLYLWAVVRLVKGQTSWQQFALVGSLMGLAIVTKYSAIILPIEFFMLIVLLTMVQSTPRSWRQQARRYFRGLLVTAGLCLFVTSLWFSFQAWHFNRIDELGWWGGIVYPLIAGDESDSTTYVIANILSGSEESDTFSQISYEGSLVDWWKTFLQEFWYIEVYGRAPLYPLHYLFGGVFILSLIMMLGWFKLWHSKRLNLEAKSTNKARLWLVILWLHSAVFLIIPLARYYITGRIHDTAQARYLIFSAAPAISILLVWGVQSSVKKSYQIWLLITFVTIFFLLSLGQLYHYQTAFPPPLPVRTNQTPVTQPIAEFDDKMQLQKYDWRIDDQILEIKLDWFLKNLVQIDYRTKILLLDNDGTLQRSWLSHPVAGRYPMRAWDEGDAVRDTIYLPLSGLKSENYTLQLQLVDEQDRPLKRTLGDTLTLGQITLSPSNTMPKFQLWYSGQPAMTDPTYRYRSAIPVTLPTQDSTLRFHGPSGFVASPMVETNNWQLYLVSHEWPSGDYELQLVETGEGVAFKVENFEWNFTLPEMIYPIEANFNSEIELLGYDLPTRRVKAGVGIPLLLYWRGLAQMRHDYTISVQLLDTDLQRRGGYDRFPRETYNTYLWVPGEIVDDGFAVPVDADAPNGIYIIRIGWYQQQAGRIVNRLPLMQAGQSLAEDSVTIGPIKVGGPPPNAVITEVSPQYPLDVNLGDIIALHGYDLQQIEQSVKLRFYWQSIQPTVTDYTLFAHVRTQNGELVAQKDQPPTVGRYPTSLWDAEEIIPDEVIIPLPDDVAGPYQLMVGLYDPRSGVRLSVENSVDDAVLLDNKLELQ